MYGNVLHRQYGFRADCYCRNRFFLSRVTMVTLPHIGQLARGKAAILCEKGWASAGRFRFLNQLTYFTEILRNSWL